jgi:hypothetical protein
LKPIMEEAIEILKVKEIVPDIGVENYAKVITG